MNPAQTVARRTVHAPRATPTRATPGPAVPTPTSDAELDRLITDAFDAERPHQSARRGVARWQVVGAVAAALGSATLALLGDGGWVLLVVAVYLALVTGLQLLAVATHLGVRSRRVPDPVLADEELPTYTVLLPAYREAAVVGQLMESVRALDYPTHLLDVIVLVERHDPETEAAVLAADPPASVRIEHVPPGTLQTKPRTCNYGLHLARGDLLVVLDAEDRPEPDQLRRAAARFAAAGPSLACVQARLRVHNGSTNLLTGCFELEYAGRWSLVKPGLVRLGLPIPLGGTSNHFRTSTLRRLGGWDAWNVTEDADLGMRIAAEGLEIDMIDAVTWEESVTDVRSWHRQRVRWHKGMLLTTCVHTRAPWRTWRTFGPKGVLVLVTMVAGNPLSALLGPPVLLLALVWADDHPVHPVLAVATAATMVTSATAQVMLSALAARDQGVTSAGRALAATPVYWMLQCRAAAVALVDVVRRPFVWAKTEHAGHGTGGAA
ncbi:MAG: glycosyltransferase [Aeromicrobium erythreum]